VLTVRGVLSGWAACQRALTLKHLTLKAGQYG